MKKFINLKTISFILLTIVLISFSMCMIANAAEACNICGIYHTPSLSGPVGIANTMYKEIYGGQLFYSQSDGGALTTYDVLRFDVNNGSFKDLWGIVGNFYLPVSALGELLCYIYAMVKLIEMSTDDTFTPERFAFILIKMAIGILIIRNGFDIVTAGMTLNQGFQVFGACLPMMVAGFTSAVYQGKTSATTIMAAGKKPEIAGKAMLFPAMIEFYALLGLVVSIILLGTPGLAA